MIESKREKDSLIRALNCAHKSQLPEELNPESKKVWLEGVGRVLKCDNSYNYVVVRNDGYGNPYVYVDYGTPAMIVKIISVYPTLFLDRTIVPDMRVPKDVTKYLISMGENEEYVNALLSDKDEDGKPKSDDNKKKDKKELKAMVVKHAISYMEKLREEERHKNEIKDYENNNEEEGLEKGNK